MISFGSLALLLETLLSKGNFFYEEKNFTGERRGKERKKNVSCLIAFGHLQRINILLILILSIGEETFL